MKYREVAWLEPRTGAGWTVWETKCGVYRILESNGQYTPHIVVKSVHAGTLHVNLNPVGEAAPTLEDAQQEVNAYHCAKHGLVVKETA